MRVARKPGHPGERGINRNPSRRESRIASAEPVCSCAFCPITIAHETAGAARTRLSLRPLALRGRPADARLGRIAPRDRGRTSSRCLTIESEIHSHVTDNQKKLAVENAKSFFTRRSFFLWRLLSASCTRSNRSTEINGVWRPL